MLVQRSLETYRSQIRGRSAAGLRHAHTASQGAGRTSTHLCGSRGTITSS